MEETTGVTWLKTLEVEGGAKSTTGITNYNLRRRQVRKKEILLEVYLPPCTPQVIPIGDTFWKNKIGKPTRKWG
jgi:hypothetical protein